MSKKLLYFLAFIAVSLIPNTGYAQEKSATLETCHTGAKNKYKYCMMAAAGDKKPVAECYEKFRSTVVGCCKFENLSQFSSGCRPYMDDFQKYVDELDTKASPSKPTGGTTKKKVVVKRVGKGKAQQ